MDPEAMENYAVQFNDLYKELPRQIIHRDPNPSNIMISGSKALRAILGYMI